jgi:malate dehydrogenase (oxaloacetate-decarboxylating)(NADP+)
MKVIINKAKIKPKRVVLADAENLSVLKAAQEVLQEGIATPILLGNKEVILQILSENSIKLPGV